MADFSQPFLSEYYMNKNENIRLLIALNIIHSNPYDYDLLLKYFSTKFCVEYARIHIETEIETEQERWTYSKLLIRSNALNKFLVDNHNELKISEVLFLIDRIGYMGYAINHKAFDIYKDEYIKFSNQYDKMTSNIFKVAWYNFVCFSQMKLYKIGKKFKKVLQ